MHTCFILQALPEDPFELNLSSGEELDTIQEYESEQTHQVGQSCSAGSELESL